MNIFLQSIWDLVCTIILWFGLILAFFVGLFLIGITFKILVNTFMAGYYLL
jgi:hypothetical protein